MQGQNVDTSFWIRPFYLFLNIKKYYISQNCANMCLSSEQQLLFKIVIIQNNYCSRIAMSKIKFWLEQLSFNVIILE